VHPKPRPATGKAFVDRFASPSRPRLLTLLPIAAIPNRENTVADSYIIETSLGTITIELDAAKAPLHTANFAKYASDGFFDGLIFHRVIPNFMIQGGGHGLDMAQKRATAGQVKNESLNGLKNRRGTLAAARLTDPDTASSQFFINLSDNDFLDGNPSTKKPGYSVFGHVTSGMDVVDKIAAVKTGTKQGFGDVPVEAVVIKSVKRAG
jgi:cyclophilin family peptidyl-prolyl cis-trans isomerase